jgi:hypothetical protein
VTAANVPRVLRLVVFVALTLLAACERSAPAGPPPSTGTPPTSAAPPRDGASPPAPAATLYLDDTAPAASPSTTAGVALAPSTGKPPPTTPAARAKAPCRVALIGDSLTDFRSGGGGYVRYLEQRCPESTFSNFAKGGAMVNQMRARQLPSVAGQPVSRFTHLVVFGGVNDLYSDETAGRTPAKIQRDLGAIYASGKLHGLRVVALTVAPWGGFTSYFNERRSAATRELNGWILDQPRAQAVDVAVDAFSLLSCGDAERICPRFEPPFRDGLHVGTLGQEALGQALFEAEFSSCS